jgi:hypothetical protein
MVETILVQVAAEPVRWVEILQPAVLQVEQEA